MPVDLILFEMVRVCPGGRGWGQWDDLVRILRLRNAEMIEY
jgi:hypothetical protein